MGLTSDPKTIDALIGALNRLKTLVGGEAVVKLSNGIGPNVPLRRVALDDGKVVLHGWSE